MDAVHYYSELDSLKLRLPLSMLRLRRSISRIGSLILPDAEYQRCSPAHIAAATGEFLAFLEKNGITFEQASVPSHI
jgi:hypothetical protein